MVEYLYLDASYNTSNASFSVVSVPYDIGRVIEEESFSGHCFHLIELHLVKHVNIMT